MRKTLLGLSLLTLTLQASAQTQVDNSDFEAWGSNSGTISGLKPTNWNSFEGASGSSVLISFYGNSTLGRSPQKRPGSPGTYSAKIWSKTVFGVVANGNMTLGKINMGSSTANDVSNYNATITGNTNFSETFTNTPDSLVVWVKFYSANAASQARVSTAIHTNVSFKDPNDAGGANEVANASRNFPSGGAVWQRLSIPFTYNLSPSGPAAYIITTFTTNATPGGGNNNDSLLIDDMQLVYVPKASFTASATGICPNGSVTFTSTSTNYPTSYSWNFGDGSPVSTTQNPSHPFTNPGTYNVTLTASNQWGSTTSSVTTITVNGLPNASLSYAQPTYCPADTDPVPTATNAGVFTSTSGLTINSSTGAIDLSASTPGTYTVTNTFTGTCTNTGTTSITINPPADATFAYPSNTICAGSPNVMPSVTDPGTFSSTPAGLVFANTTTGDINVSGSALGTYSITYNATGSVACPTSGSSSTVNITITTSPDATFSYSNTAYCADATDPAPVFGAGANGGVFSSTAGLTINSNTGEIDLSASTVGTYTITNTIAASGSCAMVDETDTITIHALPAVALANFTDVCVYNPGFALSGGTPFGGSYTGTGVTGGNFNPATAGVGSETITYSYTDATTTCSNTATNTINVEECLGVFDNEINLISAYPNPTDGKLTLSNVIGNTAFKVVSLSGQVVLDGFISTTANSIDLSSFENGIYVLQLSQEQGFQTIRIVKK